MKGQVVQLGQIPLQSKPEMPFIESKYSPSIATLKEILRSPKFVPVLVFIPAPSEGDQVSLHKSLGEDSLAHIDGGRLTEFLEKGYGTSKESNDNATVAFGNVTVDFLRMEAFRKKEPVTLTTLEFKTLRYLTRHAQRVISRDELLSEVWGFEHYPTTRSVDNIILKLRQKLEPNPSRPVHLRTIYGTGYKFLP
jgi:DNA-binding response OmpR family regulator